MKNVPRKKFVNSGAAKTEWYKAILGDIAKESVCPLCPKTMRWHTKPILKRFRGWLITENFNPYKNTAHHLLVISPIHKEKLHALTRGAWESLAYLINWAIKKFRIKGGGIALRFGDARFTGASVSHFHAHLIVPKIARGKTQPVSFPIG